MPGYRRRNAIFSTMVAVVCRFHEYDKSGIRQICNAEQIYNDKFHPADTDVQIRSEKERT